jgi:glutathione peroxidase
MIDLDDRRGKPVPVVDTASLCGLAGQVDALQTRHDRFGGRALIPAVPSDAFNQKLADAAAVREYCALTFDLTLPMTEITHVKGADAHPFYPGLRAETGCVPGWTFDRVLIAPDGGSAATFGAPVRPEGPRIAGRIAAMPE